MHLGLDGHLEYHELSSRGAGRCDVRYGADVLSRLATEDACWWPLCKQILGDDCVERARGVVVSSPGAEDQRIHRDGGFLWDDGTDYPAHALAVFVPLVDVCEACGPTQFYPGSHAATRAAMYHDPCSRPPATPLLSIGDALIFDYR